MATLDAHDLVAPIQDTALLAERAGDGCSRDGVDGHGRDAGRGRQAGAAAGDDARADDQRTAPAVVPLDGRLRLLLALYVVAKSNFPVPSEIAEATDMYTRRPTLAFFAASAIRSLTAPFPSS